MASGLSRRVSVLEADPTTASALAAEAARASAAEALALVKAANLSDVANAATARANLGLGSAATHAATDFDAAGAADGALASALAALAVETARAEAAEAALSGGGSTFDPLSLAPALWLDASQITGKNDGDTMPSWTDLSAAGNDLPSGSATYRTAIQNWLPVVRFDGVTNGFTRPRVVTVPTATVFLVGYFRAGVGLNARILGLGGSGGNGGDLFYNAGPSTWGFYAAQDGSTVDLGGDPFAPTLVTMRFTSAALVDVYLNGNLAASLDPGDAYYTSDSFGLGADVAGDNAKCDICELIVYPATLSIADCKAAGNYLRAKWAL